MIIRKAKAGDFQELRDLNKALLAETGDYFSDAIFQQEALFKLLIGSENQLIIAAEIENVVCGYAIAVISHVPDNDTIRLDQIYVKPEYRLKGVAQEIINYLASIAHKEEIDVISLRVNSKNESAISFYKRKGFVIEELIMNKRV
jgi:ribosomal protein S18 acetylase RimI-like enzyme